MHESRIVCVNNVGSIRVWTPLCFWTAGVKDTAAAAESAAEVNQRAVLAERHRDGIVFKDGETGTTFVFYHWAQMIQVSCHFFQSEPPGEE